MENKKEFKSLAEFLRVNAGLFTIFGTFTAMAAFADALSFRVMGEYLRFMLVGLSLFSGVIIAKEMKKIRNRDDFGVSVVYDFFFRTLIFLLFFYWLIDFRGIWQTGMLAMLITLFIVGTIAKLLLLRRKEKIKAWMKNHPKCGKIIFLILFIAILGPVIYVANLFANPINEFLDWF